MKTECYQIRPFDNPDLCDFKDMFRTYFRDDLKIEISDNNVDKVCLEIADSIVSGIFSLDILVVDKRLVGFICYQIDKPDSDWCEREGWGFIREIYINRSIRGKGFGTKLVAHGELALYIKGADHIYLTSDEGDKFWNICGYKKTGQISALNQSPIYEK